MEKDAGFVNLPHEMITGAIKSAVSKAMERVLAAKPSERIAYMQIALPVLEEAESNKAIYSIRCPLAPDLNARFFDYCHEMNLSPLPLLVGAMMVELNMQQLPVNLPRFSDNCGAHS